MISKHTNSSSGQNTQCTESSQNIRAATYVFLLMSKETCLLAAGTWWGGGQREQRTSSPRNVVSWWKEKETWFVRWSADENFCFYSWFCSVFFTLSSRVWNALTNNYGNVMPVDWKTSYTRSLHLPALKLTEHEVPQTTPCIHSPLSYVTVQTSKSRNGTKTKRLQQNK